MSKSLDGSLANLRVAGVFHNWFRPAVLHWWESLRAVITPCIQKAVELEMVEGTEKVFCESLEAMVSYEAISVATTLNEVTCFYNSVVLVSPWR
jgi:hypothetical protein